MRCLLRYFNFFQIACNQGPPKKRYYRQRDAAERNLSGRLSSQYTESEQGGGDMKRRILLLAALLVLSAFVLHIGAMRPSREELDRAQALELLLAQTETGLPEPLLPAPGEDARPIVFSPSQEP